MYVPRTQQFGSRCNSSEESDHDDDLKDAVVDESSVGLYGASEVADTLRTEFLEGDKKGGATRKVGRKERDGEKREGWGEVK